MAWGNVEPTPTSKKTDAPTVEYNEDYYRNLFNTRRAQSVPVRMALVGRENTAKSGSALSLCDLTKRVKVFDIDNSAKATVDHVYGGNPNIEVIPIHDETDDSIFDEDGISVNYTALIDKVNWFVKLLAQDLEEDPDAYDAVIIDGCSTYLKWCEHAMTDWLMNRSRNPVNVEDGEKFNQAEWRQRNKIYRDTLNRIHALPVNKVFFTFHLKQIKEWVDDGAGRKVLMTVGERPEWEKGTMRLFSQQIFLTRYMNKADEAAGVKGDKALAVGEWVIKANVEEMKGRFMEHLGKTYTLLSVKDGKVTWNGFPFTWDEDLPVGGEDNGDQG